VAKDFHGFRVTARRHDLPIISESGGKKSSGRKYLLYLLKFL